MTPIELHKAIDTVIAALESRQFGYCLIGGAAMPAWKHIRVTQDADFLLVTDRSPAREAEVVEVLRKQGLAHMDRADRRVVEDKVVLFFYYPVREFGVSIRMDVILAEGPFYSTVLSRRVRRKVNDLETWVASCEDLVVLKMMAGRPIDLRDAQILLQRNAGSLDLKYIEGRVVEMALEKAWANVQEPEDSS